MKYANATAGWRRLAAALAVMAMAPVLLPVVPSWFVYVIVTLEAVAPRAVVTTKIIITPSPLVYLVKAALFTVWSPVTFALMFAHATNKSIRRRAPKPVTLGTVNPVVNKHFMSGSVGFRIGIAPVDALFITLPPGMLAGAIAGGSPAILILEYHIAETPPNAAVLANATSLSFPAALLLIMPS
jgi:hypothetical protein